MTGIGLALFIAELTGVYFTGGSLNPARSFGPCVVLHEFNGYHWIYWLGPILGSIIAAGFYKFIKVLEYETANPGQDLDHAAKVRRRKHFLLAAGINEADATKVAQELSEKEAVADAGGPNGNMVANGQGRKDVEPERPMYGTGFRQPSARSMHSKRGSDESDSTMVQPTHPQRPHYSATGSQAGRFSYLGERGAVPGSAANAQALSAEMRTDSPGMTSNDQLYGSLVHGEDLALGGAVNEEQPRSQFGRTPSSYA